MLDLKLVAEAVAAASFQTRKFAKAEHEAALKIIQAKSQPADIVDNMVRLGNVSAVRQEGEKAGVFTTAPTDLNAFQRHLVEAFASLTKAAQTPKK